MSYPRGFRKPARNDRGRVLDWIAMKLREHQWRAAAPLRLLAGTVFLGFGLAKFTHHAAEAASFDRYGLPESSVFAAPVSIVPMSRRTYGRGAGALRRRH